MNIQERITELTQVVTSMKESNRMEREVAKAANKKADPPYANSVIYKMERDIDALTLFAFLDAEKKIVGNKEMERILARFTSPATGNKVVIEEGDTLIDLLTKKYPNKGMQELEDKAQAAGLVFKDGKAVKA
jgi:hypothetical protein